ncbi:MAG: hypothetical protein Q7S79_00485 [bacterium]|nr:hypothetical protein [bacterium]
MLSILDYLLKFFAAGAFSFVLWKKLKEDYTTDLIFSFTILILVFSTIGTVVGQYFLKGYSFWLVVSLETLVVAWFIKSNYFRLYELLDALVLSLLALFLGSNITELLLQVIRDQGFGIPDIYFTAQIFVSLITIILYKTYLKRYRSFSWYPSGKIGFIGLSLAASYFLLRGLVAIGTISVVPFFELARILDTVLSFLLFFVFSAWIYTRSGKARASKVEGVLKRILIWQR